MRALAKLTRVVGGELRIVRHPPIVIPIEDVVPGAEQRDLEAAIRNMIRSYRETLPRDTRHCGMPLRWVASALQWVSDGVLRPLISFLR